MCSHGGRDWLMGLEGDEGSNEEGQGREEDDGLDVGFVTVGGFSYAAAVSMVRP